VCIHNVVRQGGKPFGSFFLLQTSGFNSQERAPKPVILSTQVPFLWAGRLTLKPTRKKSIVLEFSKLFRANRVVIFCSFYHSTSDYRISILISIWFFLSLPPPHLSLSLSLSISLSLSLFLSLSLSLSLRVHDRVCRHIPMRCHIVESKDDQNKKNASSILTFSVIK
jgi:hypothetical protein